MRYVTAGESHGRALCTIVTGVPAGVPVDLSAIDSDLARRQRGYGRGGRQAIESDHVTVLSGVRFGRTLGTPVCLTVANRDWDNWVEMMAPRATSRPACARQRRGQVTPICRACSASAATTRVTSSSARALARRPREWRRAVSPRPCWRRSASSVSSYVEAIGGVRASELDPETVDAASVEESDVRCPDPDASQRMRDAIDCGARGR